MDLFQLESHVAQIGHFVLQRCQLVGVLALGVVDVLLLAVDKFGQLLDALVHELRPQLVVSLQLLHREVASDKALNVLFEELSHDLEYGEQLLFRVAQNDMALLLLIAHVSHESQDLILRKSLLFGLHPLLQIGYQLFSFLH